MRLSVAVVPGDGGAIIRSRAVGAGIGEGRRQAACDRLSFRGRHELAARSQRRIDDAERRRIGSPARRSGRQHRDAQAPFFCQQGGGQGRLQLIVAGEARRQSDSIRFNYRRVGEVVAVDSEG